jgi:3-dehydroquinate synthase
VATTIRVALGERSYDIAIDRGNLAALPAFIAQRRNCSHAVLITDERVQPLFAGALVTALEAASVRVHVLSVPAGEASKSVTQAERLWNELATAKTDRKSIVIALGGGVVGDLAGFVAATYARGLSFIQIPTTLLAQVDSSVGGKVGINLPSAKNIVGAFWQPAGVLIDLDVLMTLPEREYLSGLAEVVKYGVILDAEFFAYLEANVAGILTRDSGALEHIVARSCQLKATVVEQDEREETGLRAVLNYGHTFCHAIETVTHYGQYLHGEAVACGMVYASRLAELLGRISGDVTIRQSNLLRKLRLPTSASGLATDDLLAAMQHDKKAEHGRLKFVLPNTLGKVELVSHVPTELVSRAIESVNSDRD